MQFGLHVEPEGTSYEEIAAAADVSRQAGFDIFARSDHFLSHERPVAPLRPSDAWLTLAGLSERLDGMTFSVLMNNPNFRHPAVVAVSLAQLDAMTDGRIELGVGAGWFEREAEAFGVAMPATLPDRLRRRAEQIAVMRGLWSASEDSPFSYQGAFYTIDANAGLGISAERPFPRLIMPLTENHESVVEAVSDADECNVPFTTAAAARTALLAVDTECSRQGRDSATLEKSVTLLICCGASEADIARRAEVIGSSGSHANTTEIVGTPSAAREAVQEFMDLGISRVYVQVRDVADLDHIRIIGEEVLQPLL